MIRAFVLIFFFLTSVTWADWVPKGFKKWQDSADTTVHRKRIGGQIANYKEPGGQWAKIENNWTKQGQNYHSRNGLLKVDVTRGGQSQVELTYNDTVYTVTQQMVKLGLIDTTSWDWIGEVMKPNWPNPSAHDNVLRWHHLFPHVVYEIEKDNGVARHRIILEATFLNNVKVIYDERFDSLELALANTIRFEFSDNILDTLGLTNERVLKDLGEHIFLLPRQTLHHAGRDSMPELDVTVRQRWTRSGDTLFCTEYVMASEVMRIFNLFPDSSVSHNDETKVIDGTTNVEDTFMDESSVGRNYGANVILIVFGVTYRTLIRVKNVAAELGAEATITACVCSLYCSTNTTDGDVYACRVFKPWVEGTQVSGNDPPGATWFDWDNDAWEWTTEGCACANDDGVDNSADGGNCDDASRRDRKATAEDTETVTTVNTWYAWVISNALAQGWYDETINEEGVFLYSDADPNNNFESTEAVSNEPFWTFTYTTAGAPAANRRRAMMLR